MLRFILHRFLLMIPTLLGVAVLVFFLLRLMPGDPVATMLLGDGGGANIAQEVIAAGARAARARPAAVRAVLQVVLGRAAGRLRRTRCGPAGRSLYEIGIRLELSLQVAIMATILAVLLALPLGTLSAIFKDTWIDQSIRVFSIAGLAVPSFWLGMIIILLLLTWFSWIPPLTFTPFLKDPVGEPVAAHLARARGRLPLLGGVDAHDALLDPRGAAGGLHPHRAREGRLSSGWWWRATP